MVAKLARSLYIERKRWHSCSWSLVTLPCVLLFIWSSTFWSRIAATQQNPAPLGWWKTPAEAGQAGSKDQQAVHLIKLSFFCLTICGWKRPVITQQEFCWTWPHSFSLFPTPRSCPAVKKKVGGSMGSELKKNPVRIFLGSWGGVGDGQTLRAWKMTVWWEEHSPGSE